MKFRTCFYEKDVVQSLKDGHWPDGCVPELRAHVETCANCSDLVLVTQTFQSARSESSREVPADSPSLLWWRAQLRRRNTVAERVSRPITIAETFALLVNVMVAVVFVASQYRHGLHWASWWQEITPARLLHLLSSTSASAGWNLVLLLPMIGGLVLLSGLALYLVSEKS